MNNELFNMAAQNTTDQFAQVVAISKANPWDKYIAEVQSMAGILTDAEINRLSIMFSADVKAVVAARRIIEGK